MGEAQGTFFEPEFNRSIKVQTTEQRMTSHAGAVLLREVDHQLGLVESLGEEVLDPRNPDKIRYTATELLRERIYAFALGSENQDDLDRLAHDPAMRMATWDRPIVVHGAQQGSSYNGYYRDTVYYPQVASFSVHGDYDSTREGHRLGNGFLHATLRQGQVHTAQGAQRFIQRVIEHARAMARSFDLRLDAGYTIGRVLDELSDHKVRFCGRLKKNAVLDRLAEPYLSRPPGRPPAGGYEDVIELGNYQAEGWRHAQRLILVVVDQPDPRTGQLNLLPRSFFLITNWPRTLRSGEEVLAHYRRRGTFEDRLGEFQEAIRPHLSSREFVDNEVTMLLALLAFNLTSMLRNEFEDAIGGCWDLPRFQQSVLRAGGRVVKHARRLWLHVEQSVGPFWQVMIDRIGQLRLASRWRPPRGARRRDWVSPPSHAHLALVLRD